MLATPNRAYTSATIWAISLDCSGDKLYLPHSPASRQLRQYARLIGPQDEAHTATSVCFPHTSHLPLWAISSNFGMTHSS